MIACNSASAAMLHDARERYDVPGRRGDPAGRAPRRRGHPQRPGRRDLDPGHAPEPRLRRRVRRGPADRPSPAGLPAVRGVRRVRGDRRARAAQRGARVPRPDRGAQGVDTLVLGCTHYPLLTGVISYVMGDDVTLVSSRRGDRQGRLPGARRRRRAAPRRPAAAQPRVRHHRRPAEFERLARRFLGPEVVQATRRAVASR